MASPHKPSEFQALIVEEDDSICTALVNMMKLTVMTWRMVRYKYETDESGFTAEYGALINEILCPDPAVEFDGEGIKPSDFKNIILGPTSGFCEKFIKWAVQFSNLLYNWFAFEYTEEGTLTEEYQALICGIACAEEAVNENKLNFDDFEKWDVISGEVDLVGLEPYNPFPGNGMYVDLRGTEDAEHPVPAAGVLRMKTGVSMVSGQTYRVSLDVAGSFYQPSITYNVRVRVLRSDNTTAVLDQTIVRAGSASFSTETFDFVAGVTDTVKIQIEETSPLGGINLGAKIDDVFFTNVTTGALLFSDDFDADGLSSSDPVVAVDPDDAKEAIPVDGLSLCEKLEKLLVAFPLAVYNAVKFEYDSSGIGFTDDYSRLVCQFRQDAGGDVTVPAPTGLNASEGGTSVVVIWSASVPETGSIASYQVYRAPSSTTDPDQATLLATVPGGSTVYNDTSVVAGVVYRYWVRAVHSTGITSDWSNSDTGSAASVLTPTLPAITDLEATQGFYPTTTGFIRLMWTIPAGVDRVFYRFDIHRNTVNDFASSTKVKENAPIAQYDQPDDADIGVVLENTASGFGDIESRDAIYWHLPASGSTKYYFWVVLRKVSGSAGTVIATSAESNAAQGWVQIGTGDTGAATPVEVTVDGTVIAVPGGKTQMRILMIGAGGSASYAAPGFYSSGGAAGDVVMALIPVTAATNWTWTIPQARSVTGLFVNTPPSNGPTSHTQYEGRASKLAGPGTEDIQAAGGLSAIYDSITGIPGPANSGAETYISNIVPTEQTIKRGKSGTTAGGYGGRGGAAFGFNRPGTAAVSTKNASTNPATKYSGSSGTDNPSTIGQGGGNNGTPYMLYTFID